MSTPENTNNLRNGEYLLLPLKQKMKCMSVFQMISRFVSLKKTIRGWLGRLWEIFPRQTFTDRWVWPVSITTGVVWVWIIVFKYFYLPGRWVVMTHNHITMAMCFLRSVRHRVQDSKVSRPEPAEADVGVCPAEEEVWQRDERAKTLHLPPPDHR